MKRVIRNFWKTSLTTSNNNSLFIIIILQFTGVIIIILKGIILLLFGQFVTKKTCASNTRLIKMVMISNDVTIVKSED